MSYWETRFERLKRQQMWKAEAVTTDMWQEYIKALTALRKEVLDWYYRYAAENGMSLADARRELNARELKAFRLTLKDYIELAKKKNLPPEYIKMLDKASIRARLDRSQELYIKTARYVEELAKSQNLNMRNLLANVYEDSVYKTAYETQKLRGEFSTFREVAKRDIETAVSKPWATDGKDFSTRIWENKAQLINTLQTEMTRSFMIGEGATPLINRIQKRFSVSFSNARRLVETETAYVQEKGMLDTYEALDVEQYQILAVLDMKTSDICQHLDKKVFDKKDAKPGITMPPFHCYCRSTTIPYIDGITDGADDTRAARDPVTGKTVFAEGALNYEEWYNKYVKDKQQKSKPTDTVKLVETITELHKLKLSGMGKDAYDEYLNIINSHQNTDIKNLYAKYADGITKATFTTSKGSAYQPSSNSLTFNFNHHINYPDINKFGTLAHEYGHFFDAQATFDNIHFKEIEAVRNATGLKAIFKNVASASDEFLEAIRKDKEYIKKLFTPEIKADLMKNDASSGVQDAIDGLFPRSRIRWGHGEKYYNRKYASIQFMDKTANTSGAKALKDVYKNLGFDASNQAKTKNICRQYEAASEAWANIMSAEICGGKELEYVKKFLPNSYNALLKIVKDVK